MKLFRSFIALSIAVFAFSVVFVNAQSVSNDSQTRTIEHKVFKKILSLPFYGVFDKIGFEIDGSTVTLSGKVANIRNKKDAESAVEDIQGVEKVINNIELLPLSGFDNSIRRQMLRTFYREGGSLYRYLLEPSPSVRIIVENGHVTLEGYVSGQGDSNLATILAKTVPGVFSVTNNLIVGKEMYR